MKAAVLRKIGTPLSIETLPIPGPGHGDVLIKVAACGVCHSDIHAVDGDWDPLPNLPLIPGHEVTGTVAALGPAASGFEVGDRIGVPWMYSSCGACEFCKAGMETICPKAEATGYSKPGGYAEYMVAPAAYCGRMSNNVDLVEIAPILCAGVTTYRGLKRTGVRPGQWMAVVGIGGLGHIGLQYARAMGMRVVAIDIDDNKLEHAKTLGAELLVNSANEDPAARVKAGTGGGAHGAIVPAVAARAFEQSIGLLRPGGSVAWIGLPGGAKDAVRTTISAIVNTELTVTGSNVGTRLDLDEAVAFATTGLVKSKVETARLEDINAVFDRLRQGKVVGRIVLDMAA